LEPEILPEVKEELRRRGHQIVGGNPESFGALMQLSSTLLPALSTGGSDPRKAAARSDFGKTV
jgi:hypothetical protein